LLKPCSPAEAGLYNSFTNGEQHRNTFPPRLGQYHGMKMKLTFASLALAGLTFSHAQEVAKDDRPVVQIAILLDNSGSMQGLIQQAKTQIWQIVNEFVSAKQDGKAPRVQVGLYEYGIKDAQDDGSYVRQLVPLTEDLDSLSEKLFKIDKRDSGGSEFCGWVIKEAVEHFKWDNSPKTYKAIFIAGNEEFTQGAVNYKTSCKSAIEKGIIVNTIHCGPEDEGIRGMWKDAAAMSDGRFLIINHNAVAATIPAPQDKAIAELNSKLNDTYIAYGAKGGEGKQRQIAQDGNALSAPAAAEVLAKRAYSKASGNYSNATWDLIDRAKEKDFDVKKLAESELPDEMKKMTPEERVAFVEKKKTERTELQAKLKTLAEERDKYVTEKSKAEAKESTLGKAVSTAVREQAAKKGVTFDKP